MSRHDHDPLTPAERELAQRLARAAPRAEPSPALDAAILAAAAGDVAAQAPTPHDAARGTTPQLSPRRRVRWGWSTGLGLAASLVLAVGIAWQLRPQYEAQVASPAASGAYQAQTPAIASATDDAEAASAEDERAATATESEDVLRMTPPEAAARAAPAPTGADADGARATPRADDADAAPATAAQEAPVLFDDAAPPPPPPAPPAPPAPAREAPPAPLSEAAGAAASSAKSRERKQVQFAPAAPAREPIADRVETTGSRIVDADADRDAEGEAYDRERYHDQPLDEAPPASADSPEVRTAWLQRIRELLAEGEFDAARASLQEFRRRYPDAPLPEDLRPLTE